MNAVARVDVESRRFFVVVGGRRRGRGRAATVVRVVGSVGRSVAFLGVVRRVFALVFVLVFVLVNLVLFVVLVNFVFVILVIRVVVFVGVAGCRGGAS